MAFTWNEQTVFPTKNYIVEVRDNINSIDDSIACLANKSSYLIGHDATYNGTLCTTNNGSQNRSHDYTDHSYNYSTNKGSHDSNHDGNYDSGHKGSHESGHESSYCPYNSHVAGEDNYR